MSRPPPPLPPPPPYPPLPPPPIPLPHAPPILLCCSVSLAKLAVKCCAVKFFLSCNIFPMPGTGLGATTVLHLRDVSFFDCEIVCFLCPEKLFWFVENLLIVNKFLFSIAFPDSCHCFIYRELLRSFMGILNRWRKTLNRAAVGFT